MLFNVETEFDKDFGWQGDEGGVVAEAEGLDFKGHLVAAAFEVDGFYQSNFGVEIHFFGAEVGQKFAASGDLFECGFLEVGDNCPARCGDVRRRRLELGNVVEDGLPDHFAVARRGGEGFEIFVGVDVDLIEVAASAGAEGGDVIWSESFPQGLFDRVRIIRAEFCAASGVGVHGENGQAADRFVAMKDFENADVVIDRAGGTDEVRITKANVPTDFAVFHDGTAIKREAFLLGDADAELGRSKVRVGLLESFNDLFSAEGRVFDGLMFVFAVFGDGGVVEERAADVIKERAGVAVRGENGDVLFWDVADLSGAVACGGRDRSGDLDEVAEDERHFFGALFENDGFGFDGVVNAGAEPFIEIAGHAIADGRCDVGFGHADFERGIVFWSCGGDEGECQEKAEEAESFHVRLHDEGCVSVGSRNFNAKSQRARGAERTRIRNSKSEHSNRGRGRGGGRGRNGVTVNLCEGGAAFNLRC
jgi:hypothetical protein